MDDCSDTLQIYLYPDRNGWLMSHISGQLNKKTKQNKQTEKSKEYKEIFFASLQTFFKNVSVSLRSCLYSKIDREWDTRLEPHSLRNHWPFTTSTKVMYNLGSGSLRLGSGTLLQLGSYLTINAISFSRMFSKADTNRSCRLISWVDIISWYFLFVAQCCGG